MGASMSVDRLPYGAAEILELRKAGKRPADMVLVSLIGPLCEVNPVVIVRAEAGYDWRFLAGLDVMLVLDTRIAPATFAKVIAAIQSVRPAYLGAWFANQQDGLNLAFGSWRPRTFTCRRMGIDDRRRFVGLGRASA